VDAERGIGDSRSGHPPDEQASVRRRRSLTEIDDADVQIIGLLSRDGRLSTRAIAAMTGLAEATVAARIRSLSDRRMLGVTVIADWRAAGYGFDAWLEIDVTGAAVREVGEHVAGLVGAHAVFVVLGSTDLVVHIVVPDADTARDFIESGLGSIAGIGRIRMHVVLETSKYDVRYARLPVEIKPIQFGNAVLELDDIDRGIIDALTLDGRQPNRQIARMLSVSEGRVRMRLQRLENAGLISIVGQSDPFRTGFSTAWAIVGVTVEPRYARQAGAALSEFDDVGIVCSVGGSYDFIVMVTSRARRELAERIVDDFRSIPGVRSTCTWELISTVQLNYHLARLLAVAAPAVPDDQP
jgi:Lrp/AsnC family transcriptional regulator, regulator for asnA, asnC and gidA